MFVLTCDFHYKCIIVNVIFDHQERIQIIFYVNRQYDSRNIPTDSLEWNRWVLCHCISESSFTSWLLNSLHLVYCNNNKIYKYEFTTLTKNDNMLWNQATEVSIGTFTVMAFLCGLWGKINLNDSKPFGTTFPYWFLYSALYSMKCFHFERK